MRDWFQWRSVQLEIEARDSGNPVVKSSRVRMDVDITQTSNPYPQWIDDYTSMVFRVSESAPVNTVCSSIRFFPISRKYSFRISNLPENDELAERGGWLVELSLDRDKILE